MKMTSAYANRSLPCRKLAILILDCGIQKFGYTYVFFRIRFFGRKVATLRFEHMKYIILTENKEGNNNERKTK